jgi:hypothetical protein
VADNADIDAQIADESRGVLDADDDEAIEEVMAESGRQKSFPLSMLCLSKT